MPYNGHWGLLPGKRALRRRPRLRTTFIMPVNRRLGHRKSAQCSAPRLMLNANSDIALVVVSFALVLARPMRVLFILTLTVP
ncbi:hypothetical protein L227DRAFT_89140 [Lentinus tigrinus ALCF2SS1-6]|uniref:Uncharacterized protein n=1 Tax=Lentinus tigrinus ALCF2SS1-6 TaxID=1328759 RepID=A0A5C2SBK6_9APHY|nr:hypothetical protein L227DRAFT_89140 [Lentinus tigrinus ALCF2SS1-6]